MRSLLLLFLCSFAYAGDLTHDFKNPSFSGQGYSSHVLALEQLQYTRKEQIKDDEEAAKRDAEREEENETVNRFLANLESRIYANLSKQLVDNMFSADGATSGTAEIEGAEIYWEKDVDMGTITIRVTEDDGTVTTVTVPIGDFGF